MCVDFLFLKLAAQVKHIWGTHNQSVIKTFSCKSLEVPDMQLFLLLVKGFAASSNEGNYLQIHLVD